MIIKFTLLNKPYLEHKKLPLKELNAFKLTNPSCP